VEILIVWLIFAVATGAVASSKGRSGVGWFLIGLVGGVFALIIVAVLPNQKVEAARHEQLVSAMRASTQTQAADPRRPCPRCGESIPIAAQVCRFCNHQLGGTTA
jgi:hypothetical protein